MALVQHPRSPIRPRPNELATPDRWHSPGHTAVRSELHFAGERVRPAALVRDGQRSAGDAVLRAGRDPRSVLEVRHQRPRAGCPGRWRGAGPPLPAAGPHVGDHDLLAVTAYPHRSPRSGAARAVTLATRSAPIRRFRRVEALGMPSTLRDHEVSSQSLLAVPARRYGKAPAPCICGRRIGAGCEAASGQSCSAQICRLRFAARSARSERCQPGCRARPTAHRHLLTRLQSASEKGRNVRGSEGVISGGQHLLVEVPGGAPVA